MRLTKRVLVNRKTRRYLSSPGASSLVPQVMALKTVQRGFTSNLILSLLPKAPKAYRRLVRIERSNIVIKKKIRLTAFNTHKNMALRRLIEGESVTPALAVLYERTGPKKISVLNFVKWAKQRLRGHDLEIRRIVPKGEDRESLSQRSEAWWLERITIRRKNKS